KQLAGMLTCFLFHAALALKTCYEFTRHYGTWFSLFAISDGRWPSQLALLCSKRFTGPWREDVDRLLTADADCRLAHEGGLGGRQCASARSKKRAGRSHDEAVVLLGWPDY